MYKRLIKVGFKMLPIENKNRVQLAKERIDELSNVIIDERILFKMIWSDYKFMLFSKNFSCQDWNEFNLSEQGEKMKMLNNKFNLRLVH